GVVRIEQCKFASFQFGGINFTAPDGVGSELYVSDTSISEVGNLNVGWGIGLLTIGSGTARVSLNRVRLDNNKNGLFVFTQNGTTGRMSVTMRYSTVAGNSENGIWVVSHGAPIVTALDN